MKMKKVLILYDYFDPAYKAGGPIRSLVNLVNLMEEEVDFHILTSNQDHDGSILPVEADQWINYGNSSRVKYLSKLNRGFASIKKVVTEVKPDVVYLNGMYSLPFVVYPLWIMKKWDNTKIIMAPRGMLQSEALSIKPVKKKIYLIVLKRFCLQRNVYWHMTTEQEKTDLYAFIGDSEMVIEIGNVPDFQRNIEIKPKEAKTRRVLGTIALISPMKNFHLVLKALVNSPHEIDYIIYGPIKDQQYWSECQDLIKELPPHIQVIYKGEITPNQTGELMHGFDFYIQPSKSENFGHSIFEAFNQGVPVIISDQTPWKGLQDKKAGWDVDLQEPESLDQAIEEAINMDPKTYHEYRLGARKVAETYMEENDLVRDYELLFKQPASPS